MSDEIPGTTPTDDPFGPPPPGWQPAPKAPPAYAEPSPYGPPPDGRPSPHEPAPPPSDRKMGGWALGLCVASFVPLAWLVGVGLAIATLVRSRDGRDFGKKYAIGALVVAGIWVVAVMALSIPAGLDELEREVAADSSSRSDDAKTTSNSDLQVGNCLNDAKLAGTSEGELVEATDVELLGCDHLHNFEVYHQFMLDHDEFPGGDVIDAEARAGCKKGFKGFVGKPFNRSELFVYFYYPKESSWELADDRTVTCLLSDPAGNNFGTLRGSER